MSLLLNQPAQGNVAASPSHGVAGFSLVGASRLLKTPVKVNGMAFSFFGKIGPSLCSAHLLPEEARKGQRRASVSLAFPSLGATGFSLGIASLLLNQPAQGNIAASPSLGVTGFSLVGASRSLKTPTEVNIVAFSFFGVSDFSLVGESLLPEEDRKGQRRGNPSFGVTRPFLTLSVSLKKLAKGNDTRCGFFIFVSQHLLRLTSSLFLFFRIFPNCLDFH